MAKLITDMYVCLMPDLETSAEALDNYRIWYQIGDDADETFRKRESFDLEGQSGTDTCDTVYAAAVTEIKSREGIV
jgi:hypothetical protein